MAIYSVKIVPQLQVAAALALSLPEEPRQVIFTPYIVMNSARWRSLYISAHHSQRSLTLAYKGDFHSIYCHIWVIFTLYILSYKGDFHPVSCHIMARKRSSVTARAPAVTGEGAAQPRGTARAALRGRAARTVKAPAERGTNDDAVERLCTECHERRRNRAITFSDWHTSE